MSKSLVAEIKECRVSSVLNDDRKVYGKKFLFDGKDETCWNSDQGLPQWISFTFAEPKTVKMLTFQFQGGFAGKDCVLKALTGALDSDSEKGEAFEFVPADSNKVQEFVVPFEMTSKEFQVCFRTTSDFYGRIIVYHFDIIGS